MHLVPKRTYSDLIGFMADRHVPRRLRAPVYQAFARRVGAHLEEAEQSPEQYPTFGEFFARRLREGLRPIDGGADVVVSPCDGAVSQAGEIQGNRLLQAKGHDYRLAELLADDADARAFDGGGFVTLYLAPRDYHRVHAPVAGRITGYRSVPGTLFPVNPPSVACVDRLFVRNERLITFLATPRGRIAVIMVGATGVGSIRMSYDAGARSRLSHRRAVRTVTYDHHEIRAERGGELGAFHLGSTVILLFAKDMVVGLEQLRPGDRFLCGGALVHLARPNTNEVAA
jgi:phosphatidylserine decarboxylase